MIDHLDKEIIFEYLEYKGIKEKELIWEYVGGCIPLIQRVIRKKDEFNSLKECLEEEVELALSEIIDILRRRFNDDEKEEFERIAKIIIKDGYFKTSKDDKDITIKVIDFMAEKEILFFDPLKRKVTGNNRLYEKAFEELIN